MWLKQVEDIYTGTVLKSFLPAALPVGEQGWDHRNATFTVANLNWGATPWGNYPAPFAPRKWPWQVQVTGLMGYDVAKDALAAAIGLGVPLRLVAMHDLGYERVCNGVAYHVGAPFTQQSTFAYSFNVEWELNAPWTERNPVNTQRRSGQVPLSRSGQTAPALRSGSAYIVAITSATFTVPTSMVDGGTIGPGGVAQLPDTGPVFTITGPFGGAFGITITNYSDRFAATLFFGLALTANQTLVIDTGAWSATILQGGTSTDVSSYLSFFATQPYMMAISPGAPNTIVVACNGSGPVFDPAHSSIGIQWWRYFL